MKILRSSATVLTLLVVTAISAGASDAGSKIVASGNEQSWFDRMAAKIQLDKPNGILEINEQGWLAFIESKSKSLDSSKERLEKYKRPVGKNLLDGFDLIMRSRAASVKNARILFYYDPAAEYFLPLLTAEVKDLKQLMEHSYFGLKPDGGDLYSFSIPENAAEGAREIMNSVQVRYDGSTLICSHKDIIQAFDNDAVEASPLLKLHNKRLAVDQNVAFTFTVPGTLGELNGLNKRLAELITMQTENRNAGGFVRMGIAMMTRHFAATLNELVNISGSLDQDTDGKHKQQFVFEIKDGTPLKPFYAKLQGKEIDVFDWTAGFKQAIRDQRLKADVSIDDATISLQGTWDDNDHEFIQKQVLSPIAKWASSKEDPVPAPWAKDAVYESKPEFTELIDLSVLQKRLPELMKQAVYPLVYDGGKRLEFEIDPISAPLSGYSTDLIVDDVLDKEGRSLLRGTPRKLRFANSRPDGYRVNIMKPVEGKFGPPVKLKLTFKAKVFGETQITDFNIAEPIGTVKSDNENQYRLEVLKDDMVKVVHSGDAAFTIVAYDKTEKQLDRPTGIIHRNMGKFLGKVAGVKVLNRKPPVDCPFSVEIDLTDTSRQMPEEPSADVLTRVSRSSIDDYDGISDEQLESAKIEWQPRMKAVVMDLKGMRYSQRGETFYSAPQFFDNKGAFPVQTHTSSFSSELRCHISNRDSQERVAKANAIVGEFSFSVPSQVEWIELAVKPDSTESIIVLPNGEELVAVINKNHVKLQLKKVEGSHRSVYNWHAFNKEGQRLLTTEITRSSRNLDTNVVFWGDVSSIRVQVATGRRMVVKPFSLNMAGVSDEKMAQYQKQYDQFQEMVMTAEKVKNAVKKGGELYKYADDIAYLHYVNKTLPVEIAMSEPKGADVFGYTHKPYKGYSISASKGFTKQDGKQENHAKEDKEQQVKWDGGVLAIKRVVKHYHSGIPILFSPENKQLPTILLNEWGRIFYSLRDDLVEYAPEKPEKQGWTQLQSFFTYINLLNEFQNSK